MKSKLIKIVLSLAVACMLPMASFAAGKDLLKANIPQIYGKSKGASEGSSDLTIIHIQDAHGNAEAQENIQAMIKTLAEQGKIDAVSEEGAWWDYNMDGFNAVSEEDAQLVADYWTKYDLFDGAARYKALNDKKLPVIGNEKQELHKQNMDAFVSSQSNKKESQAMIEKIKAAMEAVKLKLYDEETRKFLETLTDFQNDKISLTAYAKSLKDKAEQAGVQWNTYNNFNKVAESITLEDKIDFAKIDKERLDMVDELETKVEKTVSDEIVTKSLNYRLGRLSASDYYDFLLSKAGSVKLDMTKYENVVQYASLVKLYAQINDDELFAETSRLEDAVKAKIFKNDAQVNFDKNLKNLDILNKMVSLEMTRADLAFYNDNKPSAVQAIAFLKDQAKSLNLGLEVTDTLGEIDQNLTSNEKFYQIAMKRDEVMVEKTLAMMDERGFKTVVLVAGGFHTEGIIKALQAKTISHMIITPRITNPDAPNYWLQNMLGEQTEATKMIKEIRANTLKKGEEDTTIVPNKELVQSVATRLKENKDLTTNDQNFEPEAVIEPVRDLNALGSTDKEKEKIVNRAQTIIQAGQKVGITVIFSEQIGFEGVNTGMNVIFQGKNGIDAGAIRKTDADGKVVVELPVGLLRAGEWADQHMKEIVGVSEASEIATKGIISTNISNLITNNSGLNQRLILLSNVQRSAPEKIEDALNDLANMSSKDPVIQKAIEKVIEFEGAIMMSGLFNNNPDKITNPQIALAAQKVNTAIVEAYNKGVIDRQSIPSSSYLPIIDLGLQDVGEVDDGVLQQSAKYYQNIHGIKDVVKDTGIITATSLSQDDAAYINIKKALEARNPGLKIVDISMDNADAENLLSDNLKPGTLIILSTAGKNLNQVGEFGKKLIGKIPGIERVIFCAPDNVGSRSSVPTNTPDSIIYNSAMGPAYTKILVNYIATMGKSNPSKVVDALKGMGLEITDNAALEKAIKDFSDEVNKNPFILNDYVRVTAILSAIAAADAQLLIAA